MRKKVVLCSFIFLLFFSVTASCTTTFLDIDSKKIMKVQDNINIELDLPIVNSIDKGVNGIFDTINSDINGFVNRITSDAKKDLFHPSYIIKSSFEVPYNNNDLLSLVVSNYEFLGGAHGMSTLIPYNYDLKTGSRLILKDLFVEGFDYKTVCDNYIRSEIEKNKDMYFDHGDYFKGVKENQDFYISKDGVTIFFQLYDIAPYAAGLRYFEVPMDKFIGKLKFDII